ncbi:MAG: CDP-alcohol phosphatidyltransferase family protein [Acidobacteria bacterium]|nr:CDP-alcohol phosphatidyltransferase family protein [Acidobacteriota bacterium]
MATTPLTASQFSRTEPAPSATRDLRSLTAAWEKKALIWMARRIPRAIHSDHLTALALVAMAGAGASYWLASTTPVGLWLASLCLVVNWFGDSLDGTLARVRDRQRPRYGFYVDHVVDEFGVAFLLGGLALSGYMSPPVAIALMVVYFMLCIEVFLATHVLGRFRMSFFKVGPTELRLLLIAGNAVAVWHPTANVLGSTLPVFDVGGAIGAAGLLVTLLYSAARNTRALYRLEPLPGAERS